MLVLNILYSELYVLARLIEVGRRLLEFVGSDVCVVDLGSDRVFLLAQPLGRVTYPQFATGGYETNNQHLSSNQE